MIQLLTDTLKYLCNYDNFKQFTIEAKVFDEDSNGRIFDFHVQYDNGIYESRINLFLPGETLNLDHEIQLNGRPFYPYRTYYNMFDWPHHCRGRANNINKACDLARKDHLNFVQAWHADPGVI